MELFLMLICYVLGAVVGYELVKFLRVAWFLHKLGKAKKMLDEALDELNGTLTSQEADELIDGTFEKSFHDLGISLHEFGTSIQKNTRRQGGRIMDKKKEMETVAFLGIGGERLDELGQKAVDLGMTVEDMQEFSQLAIACGAVLELSENPNATLLDLYDAFGATWLEQLGADE